LISFSSRTPPRVRSNTNFSPPAPSGRKRASHPSASGAPSAVRLRATLIASFNAFVRS
jgi:hypothetical protein